MSLKSECFGVNFIEVGVFCRLAFLTLAMMAAATMVEGDVIDSTLKQMLILDGKSESYADCMVHMIKATGVADDLFDMRSYLNPDGLLEKIENKARLAEFICSNGGIPFLFFLAVVLVAILSCCCCCCCMPCRSVKRPVVVQMSRPSMYLDQEMRYERMNKV